METKANESGPVFFQYRGKPLVRFGDDIYYGNMSDKYVILMNVLDCTEVHGVRVSRTIKLQLISTDTDTTPDKLVVKKTEKIGLYSALDVGAIWLSRALSQNK